VTSGERGRTEAWAASETLVGQAMPRVEDASLLRGAGWFIDDLDPWPGIHEAAIVRSSVAHARIASIDTRRARASDGVLGVLTGADLARFSSTFPSVLDVPIDYRPIATDVVRYVGEPVAVVVASDRYRAEDAADAVIVDFEPLPVAADLERAMASDAPLLHPQVGSNVVSDRRMRYGDPDAAFAGAALVVEKRFVHPRSVCTPIECFGVIARWQHETASVEAWSNFQGPFSVHGVAAAALGIPASRLRLRTPEHSGGSFGTKAAIYPAIVLMALASRVLGVPVRWTEDRVEHLLAATSATERRTDLAAAFSADGRLLGLRLDLVDDVGAYVRAPEPATLYRMHPCLTGAYEVANLDLRCRVVVTNRCPTGLNRGFGGPQLYFPLERTMAIAAERLGLDPAELARRNLVRAEHMPYESATGGRFDSGDYHACLERALELARWDERRTEAKQLRAAGRLVGVGLACVVEPSVSNMGYISLATPPERRALDLPKSGNAEGATVAMSSDGGVSVRTTTTPQGQGHATVIAQVVADALGVDPTSVQVQAGADTQSSPWTIASGNYSSRFAAVGAGAVHVAATRLADQLRRLAAAKLGCEPFEVLLRGGKATVIGQSERAVSLRRLAGAAHWDPADLPPGVEPGLAQTAYFAAPGLAGPLQDDRCNSSAAYGFLADVAVVEVDPETGRVAVLDYVSVHDAGRILNPLLAEGQVLGGLAHGLGAALFEQHVYDPDGQLLTATFLDYLVPSAPELPPRVTTAFVESPSPNSPLGAKGIGEGTTMSAPAAIANAVADALGQEDVELPITPERCWAWLAHQGSEVAR